VEAFLASDGELRRTDLCLSSQSRGYQKPHPEVLPIVSITKAGNIGLSSTVVRTFLGDAKFATFLFDRDKHLVGIKLSKVGDEHTYPIKRTPRDNYALIAGVSFLKSYGIFPHSTSSHTATFDEKNKIIVIDVADLIGNTGKKDKK
jgi:hypothetical protein